MVVVRTGICIGFLLLMWAVSAAAACLEVSGDEGKVLSALTVEDGAVVHLDFINSIYLVPVRETFLYESGKGLSIIRVESPSAGVFEYYRLEPDSHNTAKLYRHVGTIRLRSHDYNNHTLTVGRSIIRFKGLTTDGDPLTIGVKDGVICPNTATSGSRKDRGVTEPCIRQIRIAKTQDPFRGWDSKPAKMKQADQRVVRAADLKGDTFDGVPGLSRYTAGGVILMGIEKKTGEPLVSGKYFTPLARVDATRITSGQRKEIGSLLDISSRDLTLQDIALFLLESQIVATYWHVESVICLVKEEDSAGIYKASFKGIHKYFTNSYNEEKLSFAITIDRTTGTVTLEGI